MSKRRLPPMTPHERGLAGVTVESITVGSWVPNQDGTGKPVAVAMAITTNRYGDLVFRMKTPQAVDDIIQMLLRHKRDVWPDAH